MILTPKTIIEAQLGQTNPFVDISSRPAYILTSGLEVRQNLNYIVGGALKDFQQTLADGSKTIAAVSEKTLPGSRKILVLHMRLTEKGAKSRGLPAPPPEQFEDEILSLDPRSDYGIVKSEYHAYSVPDGVMMRTFFEVSLEDHQGQQNILAVTTGHKRTMAGKLLDESNCRFEFLSFRYGPIGDEEFALETLPLPEHTHIYDHITGRDFYVTPIDDKNGK